MSEPEARPQQGGHIPRGPQCEATQPQPASSAQEVAAHAKQATCEGVCLENNPPTAELGRIRGSAQPLQTKDPQ